MNSSQIRQSFIDFFKSKEHHFVSPSPIAPLDDPTLLFTNAGMNQFKDVFLGKGKRDYTRAVNSQACVRVSGKHNDLEDVGYDGTHLTLFEMLGNWSFGDYYKKEAILWAWELLTEVFKFPKEKLYATVYETDDESVELWKTVTDIRHDHILKFGDKDNFWEMGETGPCGPCSEIHVDMGEGDGTSISSDPLLGVNGENQRFIEIWNLVFIQYERQKDSSLIDLPETHVDTGAGLERLVSYIQGKTSVYETDLFVPIIEKIEKITGKPYSAGKEGVPHRVLSDHVRTVVFGIADNVFPSNEGRGYVLRRLLRRGLSYAQKLDYKKPIMCALVDDVIDKLGDYFEQLKQRKSFIIELIRSEEELFLNTLDGGLKRFEEVVLKTENKLINGGDAFKLYDTFGFPVDLTSLLAKERGYSVDLKGFDLALDAQKALSRKKQKKQIFEVQENSININIDELLPKTLHHSPEQGVAKGGEARVLTIPEDRLEMARHHTATHLLQTALRVNIGDHVFQSGSLVDTDRLRFDFSHFKALTEEQLKKIETDINQKIKEAIEITIQVLPLNEAKKTGALALFGEKYNEKAVRVVSIGDYSIEFCVGTHVKNTKMIEQVLIVNESAVAAGVRRLEAIAGRDNIEHYLQQKRTDKESEISKKLPQLFQAIDQIKKLESGFVFKNEKLKFTFDQTIDFNLYDTYDSLNELEALIVDSIKEQEKRLNKLKFSEASMNASSLIEKIKPLNTSDVSLLTSTLNDFDVKMLKSLSDEIVNSQPKCISILATTSGNSATIVVKLGRSVDSTQISAPQLVEQLTIITGGGGGGRADMAQAGGADASKLNDAFVHIKSFLETKF